MATITPADFTAPQKVGSMTQTPSVNHAVPAKQEGTGEAVATPQPEEKTVLSKEDAQIAKRYAALAREQKTVREASRRAQAEVQALKTKLAEYETSYFPKSKLSQDPLSALSELGVTYDQLTQAALNAPSAENQAISKLQREIQAMKQAQENSAKQAEEATNAQVEQAVKQMSNDAKVIADGNEKYEMLALHGEDAFETVARLIKHDFDETGVIKPIEIVMDEVEDMLVEQSLAFARSKKLQAKLAPAPQPELQKSQIPQQKQQTLSNRVSTTTKPGSAMSRRERAIAAYQGIKLE